MYDIFIGRRCEGVVVLVEDDDNDTSDTSEQTLIAKTMGCTADAAVFGPAVEGLILLRLLLSLATFGVQTGAYRFNTLSPSIYATSTPNKSKVYHSILNIHVFIT